MSFQQGLLQPRFAALKCSCCVAGSPEQRNLLAADPGRVHLLTCTPKSNSTNSTSSCGSSDGKEWLGYIGAIIAVVFFGSNFVPVKKYETGEGEK